MTNVVELKFLGKNMIDWFFFKNYFAQSFLLHAVYKKYIIGTATNS